jgi:hypothetical protein
MDYEVIKIDYSTFERVEQVNYLGTTLRYQNSAQEEIKRGLNLGNACSHLVQNLSFSSLQSKHIIL